MQNNIKLENFVAELPEIYQPIFNHPELSEAVSRDCEDRWTYIEKIYRQLENKLKRPLNVLDLGCAQGYFSFSLATCGATVLGIDYLDKNIAVCQSLAKENAKLKVNFEIGKIEEVTEKLAINQYDLVLGLSVFHHIVYEHGLDWTKKLLEKLASKITLGIFEVALKNEPLYWANAQAEKTRDLLDGFCFVRQITSFSTHLSLIPRPMYVASNVYWIFDDIVEQFNKANKNPHLYANGTHENTRQYFMSEDKITKLFLFDNQNRYKLNHIEYENEVNFLKKHSALWDGLPKILHYEQSENEAWIVRTSIKGKLLCDIIDKNELYNADQIIKDILNQVIALESFGLYHNDIRTWNVLISEDTSACLIDYGAISKKEQDCQWPYDKYLSFLTFVREVLGHKTIIPGFFRADKFDISTLPEPYKSVFFNFFNLGLDVISFEKLKELLENFDLVSDYSVGMTIYGEAIDNAIEIARNNLLLFEHQTHEANERAAQAEQNVHEANVRVEAFFQRAEQAEMLAAEVNERAAQAEQNVHEANVRVEAFFQRVEQAEDDAKRAWQYYHMIESSNSWKVTKPLRLVGKFARWFARGSYHWLTFSPTSRPRRVLKQKLITCNDYIKAHPSLKSQIVKILNLFPSMKKKLKALTLLPSEPSEIMVLQHERNELSFEAQKIFDRLIQIRDNDTNKPLLNQNAQIDTTVLKPKMAIVTPFPPDRTGIADYVAELLPDLCENYQVDIIVKQDSKYFSSLGSFQTIEYFKVNYNLYNIVIYQMGNSPYHAHMFELIQDFPGIVVLHDFYLGHLVRWMHNTCFWTGHIWDAMLIDQYGYMAPYLEKQKGVEWAINKFPLNNIVFEMAKGIIVHSSYAKNLSLKWYGDKFNHKIYILPQVHAIVDKNDSICQNSENFLVCSFGHLIKSKLIHRIIFAWQESDVGKNSNNQFLFVGSIANDEYGHKIKTMIKATPNIKITGFVENEEYQNILRKANMAIQLRSESRGETSRAVLDCMAYGIPTIVNANGSMQELPDHAVFKIQDIFDNQELIDAMNYLYENMTDAKTFSTNAKEVISRGHSPQVVVKKIQEIIQEISIASKQELSLEQFYSRNRSNGTIPNNNDDLSKLAKQFELDTRYNKTPSIYVDISAVAIYDLKTGIQRVVRSILLALLKMPLMQYKIIPVYLTDQGGYWHYRIAHNFMHTLIPNLFDRADTVIEPSKQDIFLGLDYHANAVVESMKSTLFEEWKQRSVQINFVVYDILPITLPDCFPPTSYTEHEKWLKAIIQVADNLLCISNTVSNEVKEYINMFKNGDSNIPNIKYFHLGADLDNSLPSKGIPENADAMLQLISSKITFLMVGTIEPRKRYLQSINAFSQLWRKGVEVNLVIVGNEGWKPLTESDKRTIPETIRTIQSHSELNKRFFWFEGISDEYLDQIYQASTCLIAASEGEGFGLPLIEAAQHKIPIIARDIPVFREVASNYAYYFDNDNEPIVLAKAIEEWLTLYQNGKHPKSDDMPWLTWNESANSLMKNIL